MTSKEQRDSATIIENAYTAYADAIFRHCYFRTYSRERGKELMQETFLRAWEYVRKGEKVENVRAFLYRIANNLIIDDFRRHKELSLDALKEQGFDPKGQDEKTIVRDVEDHRVLHVLSLLPKESRELIVMRFIDGLKPQEIGKILKSNPNTISVRIHRAMQDLKTLLEPS
jgi:RNA polymerase sigma-70 factor (ECF subfamily)